jgi:hypothetical protein
MKIEKQTTLNFLPDGILLIKNSQIVYKNEAFLELVKMEENEIHLNAKVHNI